MLDTRFFIGGKGRKKIWTKKAKKKVFKKLWKSHCGKGKTLWKKIELCKLTQPRQKVADKNYGETSAVYDFLLILYGWYEENTSSEDCPLKTKNAS